MCGMEKEEGGMMEKQGGFSKMEWQRKHRAEFKAIHGFSETSHYGAGKMRSFILARDEYRCLECGMTDEDHKIKWGRPITIDHKDKNRKNNSQENLRTMCLRCHGRKDLIPELTEKKISDCRLDIMASHANGETYKSISIRYGCSQATVCKWIKTWKGAN